MLDLAAAGLSQVHALAKDRLAALCTGSGAGLSQSCLGAAEPSHGFGTLGESESDMAERRTRDAEQRGARLSHARMCNGYVLVSNHMRSDRCGNDRSRQSRRCRSNNNGGNVHCVHEPCCCQVKIVCHTNSSNTLLGNTLLGNTLLGNDG